MVDFSRYSNRPDANGEGMPAVGLNDGPCETNPAGQISLCELLDRVLTKGVVLVGEVTISIADIDLIYLGLNLIVSSAETILANLGNNSLDAKIRN